MATRRLRVIVGLDYVVKFIISAAFKDETATMGEFGQKQDVRALRV